jgi:hypothetical protein
MTTSHCKPSGASNTPHARAARRAWPLALLLVTLAMPRAASAQILTQRGFVDGSLFLFPQEAANDPTRVVGDVLFREEAFLKPAPWVQFAAGFDARSSSHDEVDDRWRVDFADRGLRRPALSVRRLTATFTRHGFTLDAGKQFIRWGKTDILTPTDRFGPRDYLNVVDTELLPVLGVRAAEEIGAETFEVVWVPRFTPSRVPLLNERWTAVPPNAVGIPILDGGATFPSGSQAGIRWSHAGTGFEYSLSAFDGFNPLPNITVQLLPTPLSAAPAAIVVSRSYPSIRTYGADAAVPTRWFTIKGETAYFTSSTPGTDEYVLYVVQLERQSGEWVFVGGYAGQVVTAMRAPLLSFAPDRGLAQAVVGRASFTIDPNRSIAVEGAVRQNGAGAYAKAEYSQAYGQHWRATGTIVGLAGHSDDFLGQYHRNSHVTLLLRYSF